MVRHWSAFGLFVDIESFETTEKGFSTPIADSGFLNLKVAIAAPKITQ